MQFPNLPTDNLYKFIAISGLILILLSTVLPLWAMHNMQLEAIAINGESDLIEFEAKHLDEEIKHMEKRGEYLEALSNSKNRKQIKLDAELRKDLNKAKEINIALFNKNMQLKIKKDKVKYLVNKIGRMQSVIFIGIFIGSILTYYGFSLWYSRLQKYQDQIIKIEAQKQIQNNSDKI